ncbi:MAG: hypothetical protein IPH83_17800 [Gammaproteobacteria bacterium]|nr:hypothetical protein [Gammaproteobacteria bacterium]
MPSRSWDQLELFKGVATWIKRVSSAERIEDYVDMAFTAAWRAGVRPAVLLVSTELLAEREEKAGIATRGLPGPLPA